MQLRGDKMYACCSTVTLEQDLNKKMHIWMLQTLAFALTSLVLSWAESIEYYGEICDNACPCEEKDSILTVSCENRGIISLFEISPPRFPVYHLLLSGNLLNRLYPNQFVNYTGASILHLGSNDIQDIETGAFHGLRGLRRLHLNNNKLELLRDDTFLGLESLEYLQVDYNYISVIEPNAFSKLHLLQVLILNDNLLSGLPNNLFRFVPLTHLDLRGNRLKLLPYAGLLQHMDKVVELQLEENPWNCSCELIALKDWLDSISYSALVGDVVCETPFRLHGRDLDEVSKQELCPRRLISDYEMRPQTPLSTTGYFHTTPASVNSVATSSSAVYKSPLKPPKGTRQPNKTRVRPTSRLPAKDLGYSNYGPSIAYQTKSPVPLECPTACTCNLQISDLGLNVNCQERKIESISELQPKPYNPKKMYLTENYIVVVRRADFLEATGLDLLHLGNNRISVIQDRAFGDLSNLRRLYLNGNRLERLSPELFQGLQSLQYLFLQYNVIREIAPGTFAPVPNLQLLFLNNNLLRALPANLFSGLSLYRLSLRSNHFAALPVSGVLDQLRSLLQIDLHENPWECTCDALGMKLWLEQLGSGVLVEPVLCEAPKRFAQSDMRGIRAELLCPDYSDVVVSTPTPSSARGPARPTPSPPSSSAAAAAAGRSPAYSVSTIEPRQELLPPGPDAERFYRAAGEPEKRPLGAPGTALPDYPKFPAAYTYSPGYDLRRPHPYLHPAPGDSRLREAVLYSPPSTVYVEPNRNEYLELKAKLHAEPDYLEVLEKQTTFSQF
ncbi:PREDICTED: SLIT and NTRK-like protein 5 [Gavialis gangeticus]|uniref:SLIT and NTRK-like protein 5 n=1 Tax=Gavialis gangeticus TaxID=94835 RepID=UPI00092E4668|nr:PREDICTED: SLIT and NTRK-like protein 5 [Gavialis gangeticus]